MSQSTQESKPDVQVHINQPLQRVQNNESGVIKVIHVINILCYSFKLSKSLSVISYLNV